MENQLAEKLPNGDHGSHEYAVDVAGLDDLFAWAHDMVQDGLDGKARRHRDVKMKQQVLKIIHRNAGLAARSEFQDELNYLQRRTIALQTQLFEKMEELSVAKQIMVSLYCKLERVPELEEKLRQLEATSLNPESVEKEKRELLVALTRAIRERDYLDELVTVNEIENSRLARLLEETRGELLKLKSRPWWQRLFRP